MLAGYVLTRPLAAAVATAAAAASLGVITPTMDQLSPALRHVSTPVLLTSSTPPGSARVYGPNGTLYISGYASVVNDGEREKTYTVVLTNGDQYQTTCYGAQQCAEDDAKVIAGMAATTALWFAYQGVSSIGTGNFGQCVTDYGTCYVATPVGFFTVPPPGLYSRFLEIEDQIAAAAGYLTQQAVGTLAVTADDFSQGRLAEGLLDLGAGVLSPNGLLASLFNLTIGPGVNAQLVDERGISPTINVEIASFASTVGAVLRQTLSGGAPATAVDAAAARPVRAAVGRPSSSPASSAAAPVSGAPLASAVPRPQVQPSSGKSPAVGLRGATKPANTYATSGQPQRSLGQTVGGGGGRSIQIAGDAIS